MRSLVFILFFIFCAAGHSQTIDSIPIPVTSMLKTLRTGDSVTFYQCHVEEAIQQLATASGQTVTGKQQKYSITEKFVIVKQINDYVVNYYTSSLNVFPNRKFSGLKIREMPYWAFKKESSFPLTSQGLKVLLALERKGREAIEYDFAITKYTTNQIIIKHKKDFKQLVIGGNYVISKLVNK
jgi:hypothetical protein